MSKRRKRPPTAPSPDPNNTNVIWVMSDLAPLGGYMCTILRGDRVLHVLSPFAAVRYAAALAGHLAQAEHDASVVAQLHHIGVEKHDIAMVIDYLRDNRVHLPPGDTAPIMVEPIVSARDLRPRLTLTDGVDGWQWDPADVRQHMCDVLEVSAGVDLDQAYYIALHSLIGLDEPAARALVTRLADYRHDLRHRGN